MTFARLALLPLLATALPLAAQFEEGPGEVPYVPTPPHVVEAMLKAGEARSGDTVYDLGCGDGRIVIMAAQKFGAVKGVGVDIDPVRIKEATENAKQARVDGKVTFVEKNLFEADFREANLVTLYLLPDVNMRLRPKLVKELKTGSRIVSHAFDMGDWKPEQTIKIDGRTIYRWTITEDVKAKYGK